MSEPTALYTVTDADGDGVTLLGSEELSPAYLVCSLPGNDIDGSAVRLMPDEALALAEALIRWATQQKRLIRPFRLANTREPRWHAVDESRSTPTRLVSMCHRVAAQESLCFTNRINNDVDCHDCERVIKWMK